MGQNTPFDPFWGQFGDISLNKFGWYIKIYHLGILPASHVTYIAKITFIHWFKGRWARFCPFWPPVLPPLPQKHGKFQWFIKRCLLSISVISLTWLSGHFLTIPGILLRKYGHLGLFRGKNAPFGALWGHFGEHMSFLFTYAII